LSETQRTLPDQAGPGVTDERWIDLQFQEAFAWRALRLPEFPNSNRPTPRVPEHRATGQETTQRISAATQAATLPSPRGTHWGAQDCRGRQALGKSRVERSTALGVKQSELLGSFLAVALTVSAI